MNNNKLIGPKPHTLHKQPVQDRLDDLPEEVLQSYKAFIKGREDFGASQSYVSALRNHVLRFLHWSTQTEGVESPLDLSAKMIVSYLEEQKNIKASTLQT